MIFSWSLAPTELWYIRVKFHEINRSLSIWLGDNNWSRIFRQYIVQLTHIDELKGLFSRYFWRNELAIQKSLFVFSPLISVKNYYDIKFVARVIEQLQRHLIFLKEWETHHFLGGQMFRAAVIQICQRSRYLVNCKEQFFQGRKLCFIFFSSLPKLMGDWLMSK